MVHRPRRPEPARASADTVHSHAARRGPQCDAVLPARLPAAVLVPDRQGAARGADPDQVPRRGAGVRGRGDGAGPDVRRAVVRLRAPPSRRREAAARGHAVLRGDAAAVRRVAVGRRTDRVRLLHLGRDLRRDGDLPDVGVRRRQLQPEERPAPVSADHDRGQPRCAGGCKGRAAGRGDAVAGRADGVRDGHAGRHAVPGGPRAGRGTGGLAGHCGGARPARAAPARWHRPGAARPVPAADRPARRDPQLDQHDRRVHPRRPRQDRGGAPGRRGRLRSR